MTALQVAERTSTHPLLGGHDDAVALVDGETTVTYADLARRVDAGCLAAADADQPPLSHEYDRVRRHPPDQPPGEIEIELLVLGRSTRRGARPARRRVGGHIG